MQFAYVRLAGTGNSWQPLRAALDGVNDRLAEQGQHVWGVWFGLFGLVSNELIVCTAAAGTIDTAALSVTLGAVGEVRELELLEPTVRPTGTAPCSREGLYVFRRFAVHQADMDEVAALSQQAWTTFETADQYQAEPQGLFRPVQRSADPGYMLLLTWYDSLNSWQTSRQPAPAARENFQRRRNLTLSTSAIAARLAPASTD